jgi:hypothetical protein
MISHYPRRIRREPEPPGRWLAAHQKRAGLGVWTAGRSRQARSATKAWKRSAPFDPAALAGFASALAEPVRAWSPILPPGNHRHRPAARRIGPRPLRRPGTRAGRGRRPRVALRRDTEPDGAEALARPAPCPAASPVRLHVAGPGPYKGVDRGRPDHVRTDDAAIGRGDPGRRGGRVRVRVLGSLKP